MGKYKNDNFWTRSTLERGLATQHKLRVGSGASANWGGEGDGIGPDRAKKKPKSYNLSPFYT